MTKDQEAKALRAARKQEKARALDEAIAEAKTLLKAPAALSEAGIVKTRCWVALHDKLRRQIALRKPDLHRIQNLSWNMRDWPKFDADRAQQITESLKPTPRAPKGTHA
jgi:hypothetical protein